jgi:hypothetical protein
MAEKKNSPLTAIQNDTQFFLEYVETAFNEKLKIE